ncbi:M20 aminoacylase family protein [Caballeronia hypogeia]|nr:M20 aminoacylase family protein [Caballeronia hypogeia]
MKLIPEIELDTPAIQEIRRHLHANPELGFDVHETADYVAARLTEWGITVERGVGRTGVVGTLKRGRTLRAIGLRADMDALPIHETNDFAHKSANPGKMHACGHDGHTAMLLGAAHYLAKHGDFDGIVHFIFQPAEEAGGGAQVMVEDGLFERFPVDAVFGVHNWPGLPEGTIGLRDGAIMASSNRFKIAVRGTSCHAARPHTGRDPILAASQLVSSLQSVVSRNVDPLESAVLSVCQFHAGTADNAIPGEAVVSGTVRTFNERVTDLIEQRIKALSLAISTAFDCEVDCNFNRYYPTTQNDPDQATFAAKVAAEVVGEDKVVRNIEPTMGAEDFSYMLRARPGCFAFIGNGDGAHREHGHGLGPCELHNSNYDFNDALLPVGASYFARLVENFLAHPKGVSAIMLASQAPQEV